MYNLNAHRDDGLGRVLRILPKLTPVHLDPSPQQKMMVYLAAQVTDTIDDTAVYTNTKLIDGSFSTMNYRQVSNIRRTLVGN